MTPVVYFVVLNWNQPEMTADCLKSLEEQDYPDFRVIVVDNGSEDSSAEILEARFPWATVLRIPQNVGYSMGNNVGIEHALEEGADYLFLLNNDTTVDPYMLAQLVEVAESDPQIGMVGPKMYYYDQPNTIASTGGTITWSRGRMRHLQAGKIDDPEADAGAAFDVDYIDSCAVCAKRCVVEGIGGLDPRYFIMRDDVDWCVRAAKRGYRIVCVPRAKMWHKISATMGFASPATTYFMTRNALLFFWSHAPGGWKVLAPLQIVLQTARTLTAWTFKSKYRSDAHRRKRKANLLALRDAFRGRFGRMGDDVAAVCYGTEK